MSVRYPYCITFEGPSSAPLVLRLHFQSDRREETVITTVVHRIPHSSRGAISATNATVGLIPTNTDEFRQHPCKGRRCKACNTIECGPKSHHPSLLCTHCNRHFYDNSCMSLHRSQGLCASWIRCGICCKEFKPDKKEPHRFY